MYITMLCIGLGITKIQMPLMEGWKERFEVTPSHINICLPSPRDDPRWANECDSEHPDEPRPPNTLQKDHQIWKILLTNNVHRLLCHFLASLYGVNFSWYRGLPPYSINSQQEMVEAFHRHFSLVSRSISCPELLNRQGLMKLMSLAFHFSFPKHQRGEPGSYIHRFYSHYGVLMKSTTEGHQHILSASH